MIDDGRLLALGAVALLGGMGALRSTGSAVRLGPLFPARPKSRAGKGCFDRDPVWTIEDHRAMLTRIASGDEQACWISSGEIVVPSVSAAETAAMLDYQAVLGSTFWVQEVDTADGQHGGTDGVQVKVLTTSPDSVRRWADDEFLDPYWDVAVISPSRETLRIASHRVVWMLGRTYRVKKP